MGRFLITQSLLSSWLWSYKLENGYEDFLKTLRREPIQQTKAMRDGIHFENVLNAVLNGAEIANARMVQANYGAVPYAVRCATTSVAVEGCCN